MLGESEEEKHAAIGERDFQGEIVSMASEPGGVFAGLGVSVGTPILAGAGPAPAGVASPPPPPPPAAGGALSLVDVVGHMTAKLQSGEL